MISYLSRLSNEIIDEILDIEIGINQYKHLFSTEPGEKQPLNKEVLLSIEDYLAERIISNNQYLLLILLSF